MKSLLIIPVFVLASLCSQAQFIADSIKQVIKVEDEYPSYSPDGSKIVFMSNRHHENFEIYTMDNDGTNLRRLTYDPGLDETPIWSPDGKSIVFASNRYGNLDIFLIDPMGHELRRITRHAGNDDHPKFSADGKRIIFNSDRDQNTPPTNYEIYSVQLDGTGITRHTHHTEWDTYPAWSPDDQRILWRRVLHDSLSYRNWNSEVFIMNQDGSAQQNLTNHHGFDGYPVWSPDGKHIALVSDRQGREQIYLMKSDGTDLVAITHPPVGHEDVRPSFHPHGDRLVFNRITSNGSSIMTVDIMKTDDPIFFSEASRSMKLEQFGSSRGAAWGDFDLDGYPDLMVANAMNQTDMLYTNLEGLQFHRITEGAIVESGGWSEGVQWIDFDNDHDLDLFVATQWQHHNFLFENKGQGQFEAADAGRLTSELTSSTGSCWCDHDNDGDLDVYVMERDGANDRLFRNNGSDGFEKVGDFPYSGGDGRACIWGDTDSDGDMDLIVANYRDMSKSDPTSHRNFYYLNQGNGGFMEVLEGTLVTELTPSYGLSLIDYDQDGDQDLFITNVARTNPNQLYQNNGKGEFRPVGESLAMIEAGGPSKGQTWGDFDNDGDLDLYVANGTQHTEPENLKNYLYLNQGDGNFHKVTHGIAVTEEEISAGTGWADIDRDGDLDLFVSNWGDNQQHNSLYLNQTLGRHWMGLKLEGTQSNAMGIGARIRLKSTINGVSRWQTRWMVNNTGYGSQNEPMVHFGLGDATQIEELEIQWPSGQLDRYRQLAPDQFLRAKEGSVITAMEIATKTTP